MQLTPSLVPSYLDLAHPNAGEQERDEIASRLTDPDRRSRIFIATDQTERRVVACLRFTPIAPDALWLVGPLFDPGFPEVPPGLLHEAMAEGRSMASKIMTRPLLEQLTAPYEHALDELGFERNGERVEYRRPLSELPDETGSPLQFTTMAEVGREHSARVMQRAAAGDPDRHAGEDPLTEIQERLSDPQLTGDDACVQIGRLGGRDAAFVFAQVCPDDGWSTISFMGVLPELRGRGLGKWVQRRGFTILRERGGVLYHDGTMAANKAMIRLFESHGCQVYRRMVDYLWRSATM